jgi:hypothetical protein
VIVIGRRRIAFLFGLLALAGVATLVLSSVAGGAGPIGTCQLATETLELSHIGIHTRGSGPATRVELELHISANGEAEASGIANLRDGTSNTILVGGPRTPAPLSCADLDGDNVAGIVQVGLSLHNVRTGESFVVVITPEQEVDSSGFYPASIEITSADGRTRAFGPVILFVREHNRLSSR